jgi:hypothetical protein
MKQVSRHIISLIIFALWPAVSLWPGISSAADSLETALPSDSEILDVVAAEDHVFVELELTQGGVLARDTMGDFWRYDFDEDLFVPAQSSDLTGLGGESVEAALPVEERCIDRKDVKIGQQYVHVGYDEYVDADIIAAGRVVVQGWVQGNVRSLERVLVMPSGQVDGDIEAPEITVKEGGIVYGQQTLTTNIVDFVTQFLTAWGPTIAVFVFGFLILFTFVAISLAPRQLGNVRACIDRYRMRTLFVGGVLVLLMVPAMIVFSVTVVGLVLTVLTPVAYLMAVSAGIVAASDLYIRPLVSRFFKSRQSFMFQSLVGTLLFSALWFLAASLLLAESTTLRMVGQFAVVVAAIISLYPVCTGVGAAFLTRLGYRRYVSYRDRRPDESAGHPEPPPIPKAPPSVGRSTDLPTPPRPGTPPLSSGNE